MIKFIYFDVGGVVISDFSGNDGWDQLKAELGITPATDAEFLKIWRPYEEEVVLGKDLEAFLPILREKFNLNIPDNYSLLNGFVSRFKANKLIWPIVDKARQKNRIGLLTNMYAGMLKEIEKKDILPKTEWDVVVDSSIEMLKKPDMKLFGLAERMAQARSQEILFIDNTIGHVNAANAYGWQTYHYDASNHQESCRKLEEFLLALNLI
jgi:FMN phosphatase YigB (HAD superfamily)